LAPVAGTGGLATGEELLDAGGARQRWGRVRLREDRLAALAQGEGGFALELEYIGHIYY